MLPIRLVLRKLQLKRRLRTATNNTNPELGTKELVWNRQLLLRVPTARFVYCVLDPDAKTQLDTRVSQSTVTSPVIN